MPTSLNSVLAMLTLVFVPTVASPQGSIDVASLREQIHASLKTGHSRVSYARAYIALGEIFEDPNNSGNVVLFYSNRSQPKTLVVDVDKHDGWNREHLWPQSHGAKHTPVRSDLHHLCPTDATVNSRRGSLDFDVGGSLVPEAPETYSDSDSFEPRDDIKGDVARAMFYVDVRYEGTGGEPDLVLVDEMTSKGTTLGDLCTLLDWHLGDPPDDEERRINNEVEQVQGNRNVFVDSPDLATALYGETCGVAAPTSGTLAPFLASVASVIATGTTANSDGPLRFATWNIANFWHVEGEHLRPKRNGDPGQTRSAADYDAIRDVILKLDADVIGLQEIGSPDGVRLLFPSSDWDMVFSKRLTDDLATNPDQLDVDSERDIYTALVVKRGAARIVGTERIELNNLGGSPDRNREGTAALLDVNGQEVWVASIHLKSGCFTDDIGSSDTCKTLARQIPILEDWLDAKSSAGIPVALLGDFNRQIDRGVDEVRKDLDDGQPVGVFKFPHKEPLLCEAFKPTPRTSIDYVIVNEPLWEFVKQPIDTPNLNISDRQISDHCPVFVDVDFDQ